MLPTDTEHCSHSLDLRWHGKVSMVLKTEIRLTMETRVLSRLFQMWNPSQSFHQDFFSFIYSVLYRVFPLSWIFILIKYFYWYRKWCEDEDRWFRNRNIVIYDFPAERYYHRICEVIETVSTFLFLERINLNDILIKIL